MLVKVCGITNEQTALVAANAGADFIGFVFATSSRQITTERAREIAGQLPSHIKTVGVFVNEDIEKVQEIANLVGLDYIQLHGDETPAYCAAFSLPIIKAFSIKEQADSARLKSYDCAYYLVDSPGVKYRGGSGVPFDWNLLNNQDIPREKLILAGGLHADNIEDAIMKVQPFAVDVSSGVETDKRKDPEKIKQFLLKAKRTGENNRDSIHSTK